MTTHERWSSPPRSPTIVGSAVETIVWSSAARNMPSISAPKTGTSARPVSTSLRSPLPWCSCAKSFVQGAEDGVGRLVVGQRAVGDRARAGQQQRAEDAHGPFGRRAPARTRRRPGRARSARAAARRARGGGARAPRRRGVAGLGRELRRTRSARRRPATRRTAGAARRWRCPRPGGTRASACSLCLDGLRLDRRDQRLARREVAVDGRAADARGGGRRRAIPACGLLAEQPRGDLDDAVDVACRVGAQVLDGPRHRDTQRSA